MRRARVRVRGRVQGVFFRSEIRTRALSIAVAGWVRNEPDGSVQAVFEGTEEAVESMVAWCSRGPSGAHVEDVEVAWEDVQGESGFDVR